MRNDEQYYYIKQRTDCVENKETIKPYTKIIQSKDQFNVVKDDNQISQVSKQSLTTIIEMIQEYIEETVLWIYEDPHSYQTIEEANHSGSITKYNLLKDQDNEVNDNEWHNSRHQSPIDAELVVNSNVNTTNKHPAVYYVLLAMSSIMFIFGLIQLAQFVISKDFTIKLYSILVFIDIIGIFTTGGIGLLSVINTNAMLITLSSVMSGSLIGISTCMIVLLNVMTNFSSQALFIYCFHIPLISANMAHLIANFSFEKYQKTIQKESLNNKLLKDYC